MLPIAVILLNMGWLFFTHSFSITYAIVVTVVCLLIAASTNKRR